MLAETLGLVDGLSGSGWRKRLERFSADCRESARGAWSRASIPRMFPEPMRQGYVPAPLQRPVDGDADLGGGHAAPPSACGRQPSDSSALIPARCGSGPYHVFISIVLLLSHGETATPNTKSVPIPELHVQAPRQSVGSHVSESNPAARIFVRPPQTAGDITPQPASPRCNAVDSRAAVSAALIAKLNAVIFLLSLPPRIHRDGRSVSLPPPGPACGGASSQCGR